MLDLFHHDDIDIDLVEEIGKIPGWAILLTPDFISANGRPRFGLCAAMRKELEQDLSDFCKGGGGHSLWSHGDFDGRVQSPADIGEY